MMADSSQEIDPQESARTDDPAASPTPGPLPEAMHLDALPDYARSLLRIRVSVVAVLAQRKQKVEDLLAMGPGSIIQFNKSCDQLLDLYAGSRQVARGEAVKVGDKFGIRIKEVVLPDERFRKVG